MKEKTSLCLTFVVAFLSFLVLSAMTHESFPGFSGFCTYMAALSLVGGIATNPSRFGPYGTATLGYDSGPAYGRSSRLR